MTYCMQRSKTKSIINEIHNIREVNTCLIGTLSYSQRAYYYN